MGLGLEWRRFWLCPAKRCQPFACFTGNESFQSRPDEGGLLVNAGDLPRSIQQSIVDNDGRSHTH